jgi:hypothetical protein
VPKEGISRQSVFSLSLVSSTIYRRAPRIDWRKLSHSSCRKITPPPLLQPSRVSLRHPSAPQVLYLPPPTGLVHGTLRLRHTRVALFTTKLACPLSCVLFVGASDRIALPVDLSIFEGPLETPSSLTLPDVELLSVCHGESDKLAQLSFRTGSGPQHSRLAHVALHPLQFLVHGRGLLQQEKVCLKCRLGFAQRQEVHFSGPGFSVSLTHTTAHSPLFPHYPDHAASRAEGPRGRQGGAHTCTNPRFSHCAVRFWFWHDWAGASLPCFPHLRVQSHNRRVSETGIATACRHPAAFLFPQPAQPQQQTTSQPRVGGVERASSLQASRAARYPSQGRRHNKGSNCGAVLACGWFTGGDDRGAQGHQPPFRRILLPPRERESSSKQPHHGRGSACS